jgi:hypothetical protein
MIKTSRMMAATSPTRPCFAPRHGALVSCAPRVLCVSDDLRMVSSLMADARRTLMCLPCPGPSMYLSLSPDVSCTGATLTEPNAPSMRNGANSKVYHLPHTHARVRARTQTCMHSHISHSLTLSHTSPFMGDCACACLMCTRIPFLYDVRACPRSNHK